jgi:hypothetical protein
LTEEAAKAAERRRADDELEVRLLSAEQEYLKYGTMEGKKVGDGTILP